VTGQGEDYPAGWLTQFRRGVVAGLATVVAAVGSASVVSLVAWFIPGADTASAIGAIKAAGLVVLSGHHGGVSLDGTAVTLTPLLVTMLLAWLVVSGARRAESSSGFAGLVVGYSVGCALLAFWAHLGQTQAPVLRSTLAACVFAAIVGGVGRYWQAGWVQLSDRWQRTVRAAGLALAGYLAAGGALAVAVLIAHAHEVTAVQHQVSPGAPGLPVALLGVAAAPNATVASVGYLTGAGFEVGSNTSVSMFEVAHGRLPIFPLLAAVPTGRPAVALGVALGGLIALGAGWLIVRTVQGSQSWTDRAMDAAAAAVLVGGGVTVLTMLASGGVGGGSLRHVGGTWWAAGGCAMLIVMIGNGAWLAIDEFRSAIAGRDRTGSKTAAAADAAYTDSAREVKAATR
jgi:hypothetical protein